jgi:drug/metabolite transporter (DMT)-like permease
MKLMSGGSWKVVALTGMILMVAAALILVVTITLTPATTGAAMTSLLTLYGYD